VVVELGLRSVDQVEQDLFRANAAHAVLWAHQLQALRQLDVAQVALADGCGSMVDWIASRLDIPHARARDLLTLAKAKNAEVERLLGEGEIGLERAVALAKLSLAGATNDELSRAMGLDLAGVNRLVDRRRQISSEEEAEGFESRHLVWQRTLDDSGLRYWGEMFGVDAEVWEKAVLQRADELPQHEQVGRRQLYSDALASICADSLTGGSEGRAVTVAEIFVDADLASPTAGEAGVTLASGSRVGPNTLAEILCGGQAQVIVVDTAGRPLGASQRGETIPPAVRAAVWQRDQGRCTIDGCQSRYRLQPHHILSRYQGGDHHPDNLTLLCWFHHHVVIHQLGFELDPTSTPQRRRFLRKASPRGP
jgi:5-methylcytosine-specific restriction endonuclease McrA